MAQTCLDAGSCGAVFAATFRVRPSVHDRIKPHPAGNFATLTCR
jgi:hypothetical protein